MKKIAVIGGHGVGKTTLCNALHEHALMSGKTSILIDEVVRKCPYPINTGMCNDTSMWTISRQMYEELNAKSKNPDYIICDRSTVDPIIYLVRAMGEKNEFLFNDDISSDFYSFSVKWLDSYQIIILVTGFDPSKQKDDGVRSMDMEFGKSMDSMFQEIFSKNENTKIIESKDIFDGDLEAICKTIIS